MKKVRYSLMYIAILLSTSPASAIMLQQGDVKFDIDPATLQISADAVMVNNPQQAQKVSELHSSPSLAHWNWPERNIRITARPDGPDLRLTISSERPQIINWFSMPSHFNTLQLPVGEGSRIPLDNIQWQTYLTNALSSIDTNFDLKLPLWGLEQNDKTYSWLMLSPFSNKISFTQQGKQVVMKGSHEFNQFNQQHSFDVLLHVGTTPLSGAIRYRDYLQQSGQFSSLRDKIATVPEGEKLIGASHIYLWGNTLLAQEDVKNWSGLIGCLQSPAGAKIWQNISAEDRKTIEKLQRREPKEWQKQPLIEAINRALVLLVPLDATPENPSFLVAQQQQAVKIRKLAEQTLGVFLTPPEQWGPGLSDPVITSLHHAGLTRLWLGTDNWTVDFLHPQAVRRAKDAGYLVGSYDSYDTGIPPGVNDSWLTAQLPGKLTEKCAIVRADGTKLPGFGGDGYYLNPGCVLPFSQARMGELIKLTGLNSLFLDVDGTGMVSDDYQKDHPTSAAQMAADRNARMAWFSDTLKLPLGSEDGNAVTARHIMFAHGTETWGFGWGDRDMRQNKESPYYLGIWWPSAQPATFFSPAKVKPLYRTVIFDPRYRLPLYQAVFHDAVIATHHWTFDNLKFSDVKTTRALLSQLYNTPPLFNLSRSTLKERLPEIIKADASFRILHQALWDKALTGFSWLDKDGWVQQTTFSDGSILTVNFGDNAFNGLAAKTLRASLADVRTLDFKQQ